MSKESRCIRNLDEYIPDNEAREKKKRPKTPQDDPIFPSAIDISKKNIKTCFTKLSSRHFAFAVPRRIV